MNQVRDRPETAEVSEAALEAAYFAFLLHSGEDWDQSEHGSKAVLTEVLSAAFAASSASQTKL